MKRLARSYESMCRKQHNPKTITLRVLHTSGQSLTRHTFIAKHAENAEQRIPSSRSRPRCCNRGYVRWSPWPSRPMSAPLRNSCRPSMGISGIRSCFLTSGCACSSTGLLLIGVCPDDEVPASGWSHTPPPLPISSHPWKSSPSSSSHISFRSFARKVP